MIPVTLAVLLSLMQAAVAGREQQIHRSRNTQGRRKCASCPFSGSLHIFEVGKILIKILVTAECFELLWKTSEGELETNDEMIEAKFVTSKFLPQILCDDVFKFVIYYLPRQPLHHPFIIY